MAESWEQYLDSHREEHLRDLIEFVRLPSVSALSAHRRDVAQTADWLADRLRRAGVPEVEILATGGHPVVYGAWQVDERQPTALIYGHYDVQPVDPLNLWQSPPFEPEVRDGKLYGRGASDDKGNVFAVVCALEALARSSGGPAINLKLFFEGEEEVGSASLPAFVRERRERFACDFVISADSVMFGPNAPSLTVATKGLAGCQIDLRTAASDLHSGMAGAAVPNAIEAMSRLASSFHTRDGRVAVEGFYDRVRDLSSAERAEIAQVPVDEERYPRELGANAAWGEPGYSILERVWARPTLDLNGIWGGFTGEGSKTVTPAEAHLKVTCRLVPDQDPEEILDLIERHVAAHCPTYATATVERSPGSADPFAVRRDHPALQVAGEVLRDLYGKEPLVIRVGGTVPVSAIFQQELGADMIYFGWSMPDDALHAPNESFRLDGFRMASKGYCTYLTRLAR